MVRETQEESSEANAGIRSVLQVASEITRRRIADEGGSRQETVAEAKNIAQ